MDGRIYPYTFITVFALYLRSDSYLPSYLERAGKNCRIGFGYFNYFAVSHIGVALYLQLGS
jgi:hypothetical protein